MTLKQLQKKDTNYPNQLNRFLTNPKLTDNEKIKKLQELKKELKKSGQKSIRINDTNTRRDAK